MTAILGVNAFHGDSSACLLVDGEVVRAVEEERFTRVKHWAGIPLQSITWCLEDAGLSLKSIDHIAVNTDPRANRFRKFRYLATRLPPPSMIMQRVSTKRARTNLVEQICTSFGTEFQGKQHLVEHHRSHLASAFYASDFETASIASIDAFGDFGSAAWGWGSGTRLHSETRIFFPHSLGIYYTALTQYLGFPHYGDEYKVMGLAPYGEPEFLSELRKVVRRSDRGGFTLDMQWFTHGREGLNRVEADGQPVVGVHWAPALEALLGPARRPTESLTQRHMNIARSVQDVFEECAFDFLNALHRTYRSDNLALAGGCAMNSVANGKISERTPFKNVYVPASAGDAGGAVGAALHVWHELGGMRAKPMAHAYLGPRFDGVQVKTLLNDKESALAEARCSVREITNSGDLIALAAQALAEGKVLGWFQDRLEWGPRALGNRSILGDPRRPDMKDILNKKIKRRESFRPFAPSILSEAVTDWFTRPADVPFMTHVLPIKENRRKLIPAVTHVDGSGRLQTVTRNSNPRYYELIAEFGRLTGVPMVLNTSFNENEPVVCAPNEALNCFLRTEMDVLVIGDFYIARE